MVPVGGIQLVIDEIDGSLEGELRGVVSQAHADGRLASSGIFYLSLPDHFHEFEDCQFIDVKSGVHFFLGHDVGQFGFVGGHQVPHLELGLADAPIQGGLDLVNSRLSLASSNRPWAVSRRRRLRQPCRSPDHNRPAGGILLEQILLAANSALVVVTAAWARFNSPSATFNAA